MTPMLKTSISSYSSAASSAPAAAASASAAASESTPEPLFSPAPGPGGELDPRAAPPAALARPSPLLACAAPGTTAATTTPAHQLTAPPARAQARADHRCCMDPA